jgi:3-methyladenine DNA glycosylase AlkD
MNTSLVQELRDELVHQADPQTKASSQRFFKEEVKCYGVKTSIVQKIAQRYFVRLKGTDKKEILSLCEELLRSGYSEEAWIAANWAYWIPDKKESEDILMYERWISQYIDDWAKCDTLCNHTLGAFIEEFPEYVYTLKQWARSNNRWLRRAAAVSLIIPAKEGKFLGDIFEITDILMTEGEDLVQKGYGWLLKEASRQHQKEVFEYVMRNKHLMPRTALRYAIEKMPPDLRKRAMDRE